MIDSHQHFWRYAPATHPWISDAMGVLKRDFLPQDLRKELDAHGGGGTVAVQASQSLEETRFLLDLADENPFIKGVVGWVDLLKQDVESQLRTFEGRRKLVGIRHIVQDEPEERFLLREDFVRGVKAVLDAGLAYDILIYPNQLPAALDFAERFSGARLVLDHMAKPFIKDRKAEPWATNMFELGSLPHVHCKVSGLVTEANHRSWAEDDFKAYFDVALDAFGPARLMYGSDWPVCLLAADYGQVFHLAETFAQRLTKEEQAAFFGGTAENFYRLSP